jgi:hypothetical protein
VAERRRTGPAELAARKDLRALPELYRESAVGKCYLALAHLLDYGVTPRDASALAREMRLTYAQLHEMAPPQADGDFVDEVQQRREKRMSGLKKGSSAG